MSNWNSLGFTPPPECKACGCKMFTGLTPSSGFCEVCRPAQRIESCSICGGKAYALVGIHYMCWRCESAGRWAHTQAMERKENRNGLIFWCRVMVLASIAGWVIGFIVK